MPAPVGDYFVVFPNTQLPLAIAGILGWGEYHKAVELGHNYWLYVVLDCSSPDPRLLRVQDPVRNLAGKFTTNLDVRFGVAPEPVIDAAKDAPA